MKWFLLTSANLSKVQLIVFMLCSQAAWGNKAEVVKGGRRDLTIRSYELGVLFTAEKMKLETLPVEQLIPYDLPLQRQAPHDQTLSMLSCKR